MNNIDQLRTQVDLLFRHTPGVLLGVFVVSTTLAVFFYSPALETSIITWLLCVYALTGIRLFFVLKYKAQTELTNQRIHHWAKIATLMSLISGCQWAAAAYLFFIPDQLASALLITLMLLGMATAAVASLSVYLPAFYCYSIPTLLILAIQYFFVGEYEYTLIGVLILFYLASIIAFARNICFTIVESINLRNANARLIANLKIERDKAEEASLAKSKFLASASHDLRQPIQAISLFTYTLLNKLKEPDNLDTAEKISASTAGLQDLLNSLLDVSKLDAGVITAKNYHFDITQVTSEMIKEFTPIAEKQGIKLKRDVDEIVIDSDPVLVKRILQNLVSNAIRYTQSGGSVTVSCKQENKDCKISISDTGQGIPEDQLENIFNEFHQLNNPERDRSKGLGLGLSIVKRLSSIINTEIEVQSQLKQGTCFSFLLPMGDQAQLQPHSLATKYAHQYSPNLAGYRVIVIDDEKEVRDAIANTLEQWQCITQRFEEISHETLKEVSEVDLIVSDLRLRNNKTGIEAINDIREHAGRFIPGILVTGDTAPERIQQANKSNNLLLHKPITAAQLRLVINQAIATKPK